MPKGDERSTSQGLVGFVLLVPITQSQLSAVTAYGPTSAKEGKASRRCNAGAFLISRTSCPRIADAQPISLMVLLRKSSPSIDRLRSLGGSEARQRVQSLAAPLSSPGCPLCGHGRPRSVLIGRRPVSCPSMQRRVREGPASFSLAAVRTVGEQDRC